MTRPSLDKRAPFFRSAVQAAVLHRLVQNLDEWYEIAALAPPHVPVMTVRRELQRLVEAGVVDRREDSRPHRFRLPANGPLTPYLEALLQRTLGVEDQLRAEHAAVPGVVAAVIYGSWASAVVTPSSDVDVLILVDDDAADFDLAPIRRMQREVGDLVGRDIDTMVYRVSEARAKLASGSGFLRSVLDSPRIALVGDLDRVIGEGTGAS
jgi:predicted nucleotidyltransferase